MQALRREAFEDFQQAVDDYARAGRRQQAMYRAFPTDSQAHTAMQAIVDDCERRMKTAYTGWHETLLSDVMCPNAAFGVLAYGALLDYAAGETDSIEDFAEELGFTLDNTPRA